MVADLIIKDDVESYSFIAHANLQLLDETFKMGYPKLETTTHRKTFYAGKDLLGSEFGPRKVSFGFHAVGDTDNAADAIINKISRMIIRSQSDTYVSGGQYNKIRYSEGNDTGDNGLILRVNFGGYTRAITTESANEEDIIQSSGYFTLRIISAELEVLKIYSGLRTKEVDGSLKYYRECILSFECEPFFLGPSEILETSADITTDMGLAGFSNGICAPIPRPYNVNAGYTNAYNKFVISGSAIKGDAPMPIRLSAFHEAKSIILARDAGVSLLNNPSFPEMLSGTARNDIFVYGQIKEPETYIYRVETRSDSLNGEYRTSDDNGATWSSWNTIAPGVSNQILGAGGEQHDAYVVFPSENAADYDAAGVWKFNSHQSYIPGNGATNYNTLTNSLFNGTIGQQIDEFKFTVPPGCFSRYAVFANIIAQGRHEYKMGVRYFMPGSEAEWYYTEDSQFTWTQMGDKNYNDCIVNLGLIDFSPRGTPGSLNPQFGFMGEVKVLTRNLQYQSTPTGTIEVRNIWLVPIQDKYGFMYSVWNMINRGVTVHSNYDAANPYRIFTTANWLAPYDNADALAEAAPITYGVPMDGTMAGNIPMLIPGVDNTIMMLAFGTGATIPDWRSQELLPTNAKEITFGLAGRPRYLSIPGS